MKAIAQQEIELFECIRNSPGENLALVSTKLKGLETTCIAWISRQGKDYVIQPLAVLVNDSIFPILKKP